MRWIAAATAAMVLVSGAVYLLLDGGTNREECLAEPSAGCLLDLAAEGVPEAAGVQVRSNLVRDIAVAWAEARDFDAAYALSRGLQDERHRRETLLGIARQQAKAGQHETAVSTIESVLGAADGDDADLKGKAAVVYAEIGNAPSALRIASQITDDTKRKDDLADVYVALANAGLIEFADYVAKFDFSGDSRRLEAHVIRLAELSENLAKAGEIKTSRSVLQAARQQAVTVPSASVSSALSAAKITLVTQTGRFDTALKLATMNRDLQSRVADVLKVAKAIAKSGQGQVPLSTLDKLMIDVRALSEPKRREALLAFMATTYAVSGYPEQASDAISEISISMFRASAYSAVARWLLWIGVQC